MALEKLERRLSNLSTGLPALACRCGRSCLWSLLKHSSGLRMQVLAGCNKSSTQLVCQPQHLTAIAFCLLYRERHAALCFLHRNSCNQHCSCSKQPNGVAATACKAIWCHDSPWQKRDRTQMLASCKRLHCTSLFMPQCPLYHQLLLMCGLEITESPK